MKRLLATMLVPILCQPCSAQGEAPEHLQQELASFAAEAASIEQNIADIGQLDEVAFDADAPMPEPAEAGQSAVAADGGLLFDTANSAFSYVGNVRLNHPALQLRAAHRLYIRLPISEKAKKIRDEQSPSGAAHVSSAPPENQTSASDPATTGPTAHVTARNAAVDVRQSRLLLEGLPELKMDRGADRISLQAQKSGEAAQVYCNAGGDVLLLGSDMVFIWHDTQGAEWKLEVESGPVVYHAAARRLAVDGTARINSPQGALACKRGLQVTFAAGGKKAPSSPFGVFAAMQFKQIEQMQAHGDVELHTPAAPDRPAGYAYCRDSLVYDARTGQCVLGGEPCKLTYGKNSLDVHGTVILLPEGDARIVSSRDITGRYERPVPGSDGETVCGEFSTPGSIIYKAAENSISIPSGGLRAQDSLASFACTGEVHITLIPAEQASAPKAGMPNLAIAQSRGVQTVQATGNVQLHSVATPGSPAYDAECEQVYAHIPDGEIKISALPGKSAIARYGEYELSARAPGDAPSFIHLDARGNIVAEGEQIYAAMPGSKGKAELTCAQQMRLERTPGMLTLAADSRITSPDGILTAPGALYVELAADTEAPTRAPKNYPQLSYNYTGLRRASTPTGGTLRTTQVSMQCDGPINVELKPGAEATATDPRSSISAASAAGHVQLAGKDGSGRLLHAAGDTLEFDSATGNFYLRGHRVTLADEYNTHTASGSSACVTIDPHNNVRIMGERQSTTAHRIHNQIEHYKKK